jgi:hypothetical protein
MESSPGDMPKIDKPKMDSEPEYSNTPDGFTNIKYPFNGRATNLIDKFLVFAYDQKTKEYTVENHLDYKFRETVDTRYCSCDFQERPNIINEICNDYHKDLLDNELISELIFPNIPKMYYLPKSDVNLQKEENDDILTQTYQIIFSINPQDNVGSKKSHNGLGYTFYLKEEHKDSKTGELKGYMFYPVTYCILSEFPYFQKFTKICKIVKNQLGKETDEIPIDIILYNTVKYMPSPINKGVKLNFGASFNSSFNLSSKDLNKKINENELNLRYSSSIKDDGIPTITFPQLSGYPLMDINMSFILNLIPPEIIIEVFIFTFLEQDIIFYSTRPEVLNMVMFIFSNLNYPFNDSIYYWHVLSVSLQSFMSGTSHFVGKTCSTITGILNEYQQNVYTTKKIREHFVLDIDNKNFVFLYSEENEDVRKTMTLHNYIKTCASSLEEKNIVVEKDKNKSKINEKQYDDGVGLYNAIVDLQEELTRRSKKVTSINYNDKVNKPSFLRTYEDEDEEECMEANLRLQKAFFIFITQILQKYVQILEVNSGDDMEDRSASISNFKINIKKDQNQNDEDFQRKKLAIQAGQIFKSKFMESSKYSSFVINFLQFHDTIDLYKIPYTFISEFIYYSHVAEKNNLSEVDVFRLIDKFYGKTKRLSLDEEIKNIKNKGKLKEKNKDKKKINENNSIIKNEREDEDYLYFRFDVFVNYYLNHLKTYMVREQEDDKDSFFRVKKPTRNKSFGRKGFVLSNKILLKYMNFINNLENPLKEFQFLDIPNKAEDLKMDELDKYNINNNHIAKYELVEISEVVERHFIMERCFTSYGLIKFSLLNVLAITRSFYKGNYVKSREDIKKMCQFCKQTKSLVRKYMFIYLNIFNSLKKQHYLEDNICDECTKVIANYFDETNMIPTEAISKTLLDISNKKSGNSSELKDKTTNIATDPFGNNHKDVAMTKNDYFSKNKKTKVFAECLSLIETVFNGNFKAFQMVEEPKDLKFFEDNYNFIKSSLIKKLPEGKDKKEKEKEINKKKFDLKTPLALYRDSYNALNLYLQRYNIEDIDLEDLYCNILSLIYYFKIPIIEDKWIEKLRTSEKKREKLIPKDKVKEKAPDKNKDKKKDKDKCGEEGLVKNKEKDSCPMELIQKTIPDIIQMLTELFCDVKKYLPKQKKNSKK